MLKFPNSLEEGTKLSEKGNQIKFKFFSKIRSLIKTLIKILYILIKTLTSCGLKFLNVDLP